MILTAMLNLHEKNQGLYDLWPYVGFSSQEPLDPSYPTQTTPEGFSWLYGISEP